MNFMEFPIKITETPSMFNTLQGIHPNCKTWCLDQFWRVLQLRISKWKILVNILEENRVSNV